MVNRTGHMSVKRAVTDVRKFHALGRESIEDCPGRLPAGQGQKLGRAAGLNRDMVEKSRRFAQEFSKRDLNAMCREIERGGFPVGVQVIVRLMRMKGDQRRWSFLRKTIEQKWSCRDLASAIQQKTGRRPRTGRTPVVEDQGDAVQKLLRMCEQWQRLLTVMEKGGIEMQMSRGIRNELEACGSALNRLFRQLIKAH